LHRQRVIEILQAGVAGSGASGATRRAAATAAVSPVLAECTVRTRENNNC
jgi:hypothetical protein